MLYKYDSVWLYIYIYIYIHYIHIHILIRCMYMNSLKRYGMRVCQRVCYVLIRRCLVLCSTKVCHESARIPLIFWPSSAKFALWRPTRNLGYVWICMLLIAIKYCYYMLLPQVMVSRIAKKFASYGCQSLEAVLLSVPHGNKWAPDPFQYSSHRNTDGEEMGRISVVPVFHEFDPDLRAWKSLSHCSFSSSSSPRCCCDCSTFATGQLCTTWGV